MIGQQKRQLEPDESSQPLKYPKRAGSSKYAEANNWVKPDTNVLKEGPDSGTELKQEVSQDGPQNHEETRMPLLVKQLVSSIPYNGSFHPSKQQESATPDKMKVPGLPLPCNPPVCPTAHVRWLPSPSRHIVDPTHEVDEQNAMTTSDSCDEMSYSHFSDQRSLSGHKRVPVGADFQVDVPLWEARSANSTRIESLRSAECRSESKDDNDESKWLGFQVWPFPERKEMDCRNGSGKDRADNCSCIRRGSVECIQLHTQEETNRLMVELCEAFQLWGFDRMGESVSEFWSEEEEQRFKMLVKINPASLRRNFWRTLPFAFPNRNMRELVSYYFNVFVLRRRAIQNRIDPENIDSDDDEFDSTSYESDDGEGYDTDEAESDQDDSDEDKAERNRRQSPGDRREQVIKAASFLKSDVIRSNIYNGPCLEDDDTNNASGELESSSSDTNADPDSLDEHMHISSSMPVFEWNRDLQFSGKHLQENYRMLEEDENWNNHQWVQANHTQERDVHSKLRSSLEFEISPHLKESSLHKEPPAVQLSSVEICGSDFWVGYMDIIPRKSIDKLISTTGLITELFGDGPKEVDAENKVTGHRISDLVLHGRRGEAE